MVHDALANDELTDIEPVLVQDLGGQLDLLAGLRALGLAH
jgi:hypothetical protein